MKMMGDTRGEEEGEEGEEEGEEGEEEGEEGEEEGEEREKRRGKVEERRGGRKKGEGGGGKGREERYNMMCSCSSKYLPPPTHPPHLPTPHLALFSLHPPTSPSQLHSPLSPCSPPLQEPHSPLPVCQVEELPAPVVLSSQ